MSAPPDRRGTQRLQLGGGDHSPDAGCFHSLGTGFGFVLDRLAIVEGFEALSFDDGVVDHDVATAGFWSDETETLLVVKPFNFPHRHVRPFLSLRSLGRQP